MRDFARLRQTLRTALCTAPLLVGCNGDHHPRDHMPTCPSGDWCGPGAEAAAFATKEATDKLGCKTALYDDQFQPAADDAGTKPPNWPGGELFLDEPSTQAKRAAHDNATCCYHWVHPCPGGRALVIDGRAVVASAIGGDIGDALARAWLADALTEHASIASFARAGQELVAVGAPHALVAATADALRDEIRHAEHCFALASRYAGKSLAAGPLPPAPPRAPDLVRLACDTFLEGGVGETIAALAATRALASCRDPEVARVLRGIVADETRHAALAWQTIAWTIDRGGDPVRAAIRALAVPPVRAPGGRDPRLAAHGRLDEAAAILAEHDAWHGVILPMLA
jgi:hypothetical protein